MKGMVLEPLQRRAVPRLSAWRSPARIGCFAIREVERGGEMECGRPCARNGYNLAGQAELVGEWIGMTLTSLTCPPALPFMVHCQGGWWKTRQGPPWYYDSDTKMQPEPFCLPWQYMAVHGSVVGPGSSHGVSRHCGCQIRPRTSCGAACTSLMPAPSVAPPPPPPRLQPRPQPPQPPRPARSSPACTPRPCGAGAPPWA